MQNTAVYAPITFEEIVMVMIKSIIVFERETLLSLFFIKSVGCSVGDVQLVLLWPLQLAQKNENNYQQL